MKKCGKCGIKKDNSSYYKHSVAPDGLQAWCKECMKSKNNYYQLRWKVLLRDNFTCQYCGLTPKDNIKLEIDHIIPKSKKGVDNINNLITACHLCNKGKSDILLKQHELDKIKKLIEMPQDLV